jgi:hypothetical protein
MATSAALAISLYLSKLEPRIIVAAQILASLAISLAFLALLGALQYRVKTWPISTGSLVPYVTAAVLLVVMITPVLWRASGGRIAKISVGTFAVAAQLAIGLLVGLMVACSNGDCI